MPDSTPLPKETQMANRHERFVPLVDVLRIVSEHPEYPDPCPMLHELAGKAAAEMDKEWVMHMVREACRQTKNAILEDLKNALLNSQSSAPTTMTTDPPLEAPTETSAE